MLTALALTLALGDPTPPNVVVFVADDLGVESLAAYGAGSHIPNTPTIDALAADGVRFDNVWSYPLCSPTRATLATGRYGFRTSVGALLTWGGPSLPLDEVILPEMLAADGVYASAAFGKWHLANDTGGNGNGPLLAGWPHFEGLGFAGVEGYYSWTKYTNGVESHETAYMTTDQIDDAIEWVGQQTQPWLAYVLFVAPHVPLHAPPDHLHSVDLDSAGPVAEDPRPYFEAMVEAMDTEMGRFLDSLGAERDNTVVIFTADNGTQDVALAPGLPKSKAKGTLYELGINVPLIVSGPGVVDPGRSEEALVSTVDLFSTVADVAGVDVAAHFPDLVLDSVSFWPYVGDPSQEPLRDFVYSEHFTPTTTAAPLTARRAARDGRYKLIDREFEPDEAYDLLLDRFEEENLLLGALSPQEQAAIDALYAHIEGLVGDLEPSAHPYGCGLNEPSSLTASGVPVIGQEMSVSIQHPHDTQLPGSDVFLFISEAPDPAFPCGDLQPGWSFSGAGNGETLIDKQQTIKIFTDAWSGPNQPIDFPFTIPANQALIGVSFYFQGGVVGLPGSAVTVGVTNALRLTVGAP